MGSPKKLIKSYEFFKEKAQNNEEFSLNDIALYADWKQGTISTYPSKKWKSILRKKPNGKYIVEHLPKSEKEYLNLMSQKNEKILGTPESELPENYRDLVIKARESALLSIDIYNRPATVFRTEGFIVMMVIAWRNLLHAIFERDGKSYISVDKKGNPILIDGETTYWSLSECMKEYFTKSSDPIKANLEFIIGLRNKIEHRFVPPIDNEVVGFCQALLLNFDEIIVKEFGEYFAIKDTLSFPLQTGTYRHDGTYKAMKRLMQTHYEEVNAYIETFKNTLDESIWNDSKFSFRIFLVKKTANHIKSSDKAIEFINSDEINADIDKYLIAYKSKPMPVANLDNLKPSSVVAKVMEKIQKQFNLHLHDKARYFFNIVKKGADGKINYESCDAKYIIRDVTHNDFTYTPAWVDFLFEKLSDEHIYNQLKLFKKP